jgi:hypothetical protein
MAMPRGKARLRLVPSDRFGAIVGAVLRRHHRPLEQAALDEGSDRLAFLPHHRPGLLGPGCDQLIEVLAGDDVAVVGEIRALGPAHLDRASEGVGPQALIAVEGRELLGQPHVFELADRARGEGVTAGLLPRVALLLEQGYLMAGLGQPVGARRPGRPTADHQHVDATGH